MDRYFEVIADEWGKGAEALAQWTLRHLVNRIDVWTSYIPAHRRHTTAGGREVVLVTAPFGRARGKEFLTKGTLVRHFAGRDVGHLVGLHALGADGMARWFAIDIDLHDKDEPMLRDANRTAALAWWEALSRRGFDPLLFDSNGAGGYHVLCVLAEPAPGPDVFALVQEVVSDFARYGLARAPETYPRQGAVEPGGNGSALRLFGRHHTRPHFTRVWSGDPELDAPWLEGEAAIERILATRLAPRSLVPSQAAAAPSIAPKKPAQKLSTRRARICVDLDGVLAHYDGWKGLEFMGEPIPGAVELTKKLSEIGDVVIFTTRCSVGPHLEELRHEASLPWTTAPDAVQAMLPPFLEHRVRYWLDKHGFKYVEVFAGQGKPLASAYVDDRAVSCRPQERADAYVRAIEQVRALVRSSARTADAQVEAIGAAPAEIQEIERRWPELDEATRAQVIALVRGKA